MSPPEFALASELPLLGRNRFVELLFRTAFSLQSACVFRVGVLGVLHGKCHIEGKGPKVSRLHPACGVLEADVRSLAWL